MVQLAGAWRRYRLPLLVGAAGAVVVAGFAYVLYVPSPASLPPHGGPPPIPYDRIEGLDLIFSYTADAGNHNASGYLSPSPECDPCPFDATPGTGWAFSFNLTNNDTAPHAVQEISVVAPFVLDSTSPSLPATIAANGTVTFSLEVTDPPSPGYYFLDGSIDAY